MLVRLLARKLRTLFRFHDRTSLTTQRATTRGGNFDRRAVTYSRRRRFRQNACDRFPHRVLNRGAGCLATEHSGSYLHEQSGRRDAQARQQTTRRSRNRERTAGFNFSRFVCANSAARYRSVAGRLHAFIHNLRSGRYSSSDQKLHSRPGFRR